MISGNAPELPAYRFCTDYYPDSIPIPGAAYSLVQSFPDGFACDHFFSAYPAGQQK